MAIKRGLVYEVLPRCVGTTLVLGFLIGMDVFWCVSFVRRLREWREPLGLCHRVHSNSYRSCRRIRHRQAFPSLRFSASRLLRHELHLAPPGDGVHIPRYNVLSSSAGHAYGTAKVAGVLSGVALTARCLQTPQSQKGCGHLRIRAGHRWTNIDDMSTGSLEATSKLDRTLYGGLARTRTSSGWTSIDMLA